MGRSWVCYPSCPRLHEQPTRPSWLEPEILAALVMAVMIAWMWWKLL